MSFVNFLDDRTSFCLSVESFSDELPLKTSHVCVNRVGGEEVDEFWTEQESLRASVCGCELVCSSLQEMLSMKSSEKGQTLKAASMGSVL